MPVLTTARRISIACGLSLALGGSASAQSPADSAIRPTTPLVVPFLAQSELLCGGAALAMVERFYGRRGVYAEEFAALVDRARGGIGTTELARAAGSRGWDARALDGTPLLVRQALADTVPVIVLIQVAPRRYHYVVIVGWSAGSVQYHDPAVGPDRRVDEAHFLAAWQGGENWALIMTPAAPAAEPSLSTPQRPSLPRPDALDSRTALPCPAFLEQAFAAAAEDSLEKAAALLDQARSGCPDEPRILREQAGVRFRQRRFAEADSLIKWYLRQEPGDTLGWQIAASSRYLQGDRLGALNDWNNIGRPTIDLVRIDGVHRVRYPMLESQMGLNHGVMLTASGLTLVRRRLEAVPALSGAGVGYQPVIGGLAEVRAAVSERPLLPRWWALLAGNGASALGAHRVSLGVASPLGLGELWSAWWRWDRAHPEVGGAAELPLRLGLPGVIGFEGGWERWRYSTAPAFEETRRAGSVQFGTWLSKAIRSSIGVRIEHWSADRQYLVPQGAFDLRPAGDHLTLRGTLEHAWVLASVSAYSRGSLAAEWASAHGLRQTVWAARIGVDAASDGAPLGVRPMASGDLPSAIPLRAHPWSDGGVIPGRTIGGTIVHGGVSGDRPIVRTGLVTIAAGLFLDGAEVRGAAEGSDRNRFYLDGGAGLRIGLLEGELGVIRIDLATGLLDRTTRLTVGVHQEWPTLQGRNH